jgi:hypothetical protein
VAPNRFDAFSKTETSRETETGNCEEANWQLDTENPIDSVSECEIDISRDSTSLFESLNMMDLRNTTEVPISTDLESPPDSIKRSDSEPGTEISGFADLFGKLESVS